MTEERRVMTGAEIVVQALRDQGVEVVFGYPGGAVLPIYDEIFKQNAIRHILVRHEQGATHMAEGYARSTGKPGVVLVTSGPGATNAVTGMTDALMDSIPMVVLTGQVPTFMIGNDAFQEADTVGITRPCTKHNWLVKDTDRLADTIHQAFHVATHGRPGPVLVDIPKDVQFAEGRYIRPEQARTSHYQPRTRGDARGHRSGGRDPRDGRAPDPLHRRRRHQFRPARHPAAARAGRGDGLSRHLDADGPRRLPRFRARLDGHAGHARHLRGEHGDAWLRRHVLHRRALRRPHHRAHRRLQPRLAQGAHRHRRRPRSTRTSASTCPSSATSPRCWRSCWRSGAIAGRATADTSDWHAQIEAWRAVDCLRYAPSKKSIKPQYAVQRLEALTKGRDRYITTEVGQHQMWAAQFLTFEEPNRWMTSGGLGTMGYGLPASIGVQIAHPDSLVVNVAGEASWCMVMQEMSTAVQYRLPVKQFILNNERLGMVRQWQQLLHGERYSHSYSESLPDFVKLAEAFGCKGIRCSDPAELDDAIEEMLAYDGPVIFDCLVERHENCFPMIPSGKAHNEMLLGEASTEGAIGEKGAVLV